MKTFITLIFCFIVLILDAQENLLLVHNQVNFGYINLNGDTILSFKYKNANLFSEELAAVREKGHFGFINTKGYYVLPPSYDYAEDFTKGYAKIWIKGICYLIDKNGKPLFVGEYIDLDWDRKSDTIKVKTITNRIGAVNKKGNILLDTIAEEVRDYYDSYSPNKTKYFGKKYKKASLYGKVGIITKNRKFVIPPKYSSIEFLTDSLLIVKGNSYKNIFIIDFNENILLDSIFLRVYDVSDYAIGVQTKKTYKRGLLNLNLEYVFDTIYEDITHLKKFYIELENVQNEKGLFHFNGDTIVPFGKYKSFGGGSEKYFIVDFLDKKIKDNTLVFGVIDTTGQLLKKWRLSDFESNYLNFNFFSIKNNEYVIIKRKSDKKQFNFNIITGELNSIKPINPKKSLSKKNEKKLNTTHLEMKNLSYKLYNNKGVLVSDKKFYDYKTDNNSIRYENFIVSSSNNTNTKQWSVIDTLGNYLIPPIYAEILRLSEQKSFFTVVDTNNKRGVFSIEEDKIIIPLSDFSSFRMTEDHFIIGRDDSLQYTFNTKGKNIWTEHLYFKKRNPNSYLVQKVDIDFQYKAWYNVSVGDFSIEKKEKWFGAAFPQYAPNVQANVNFPDNQISIIVDTSKIDTINNQYLGYSMYLVNLSSDTLAFASQDGRLYLKMQALDENGTWKDIDHLANSWCGNSYGLRWLQPNGLWQFSIPMYNGVIKTKLRMVLISSKLKTYSNNKRYMYYNELRKNKEEWIYSQPFNGYINPAQFWRKLKPSRFSLYRN
jgi:hypothetical protein